MPQRKRPASPDAFEDTRELERVAAGDTAPFPSFDFSSHFDVNDVADDDYDDYEEREELDDGYDDDFDDYPYDAGATAPLHKRRGAFDRAPYDDGYRDEAAYDYGRAHQASSGSGSYGNGFGDVYEDWDAYDRGDYVADGRARVREEAAAGYGKINKGLILGIVLALGLVFALFVGWNRWFRFNDAADIQGMWLDEEHGTSLVIDGDSIEITADAEYNYTLDPLSKTIKYTFGDSSGYSSYRFSEDRDTLVLIDNQPADWMIELGLKTDDLMEAQTLPEGTTRLVRVDDAHTLELETSKSSSSSTTQDASAENEGYESSDSYSYGSSGSAGSSGGYDYGYGYDSGSAYNYSYSSSGSSGSDYGYYDTSVDAYGSGASDAYSNGSSTDGTDNASAPYDTTGAAGAGSADGAGSSQDAPVTSGSESSAASGAGAVSDGASAASGSY